LLHFQNTWFFNKKELKPHSPENKGLLIFPSEIKVGSNVYNMKGILFIQINRVTVAIAI